MLYQCSKCLKYFDKKCHYNQHLGRKIQCKEVINKKLDDDVNKKLEEYTISIESVKNNLSDKNILIPYLSDKLSDKLEEDPINNIFINSKENGYKCLICNIIYKHPQSLYTHKKQKHKNYEEEIKNINNIQKEKSEIEQFKELFLEKQDYYEKQLNALNEKNKQLELLVNTSKSYS